MSQIFTGFGHRHAQDAQEHIRVKLCTKFLQDLATDVPRTLRITFRSNCLLNFYRIWPQKCRGRSGSHLGQIVYYFFTGFGHRRAQDTQDQILAQSCIKFLRVLARLPFSEPRLLFLFFFKKQKCPGICLSVFIRRQRCPRILLSALFRTNIFALNLEMSPL